MTIQESYVKQGDGFTTFSGPDAVELFRATALASGLGLYAKTGMRPNRAWTVTNMLKLAERYTGTKYPKNKAGAGLAELDVRLFVQNLKAAMSYRNEKDQPI